MQGPPGHTGECGPELSRRAWLATAALGALSGSARAEDPKQPAPQKRGKAESTRGTDEAKLRQQARAEMDELAAIEAQARKAGLTGFRVTRKTHFLCIGDAPDNFRRRALEICEKLEQDFVSHFRISLRFDLERPRRRLIVVAVADGEGFARFSGMEAAPGIGGYYDRETNRLVILDNRALNQSDLAQAKQANLLSLVHEAVHQLCFNSGLLDREADVPVAISEGLATYAEIWEPSGTGRRLGRDNLGRRQGLQLALRQNSPWIPVTKLLADDDIFSGANANDALLQLAYAESWLLVYDHLSSRARVESFRGYLKALAERQDAKHRIEDAQTHLGRLDEVDRRLRTLARWPNAG